MKRFVLPILLSTLGCAAFGQNFSGGFNFTLPPADTAWSRFLPSFPRSPLTEEDFVGLTPDGHFGVRGIPIRFFGANLVADGAFPTAMRAWYIAGRLRKMGFNLVRLHHMDNPWSDGSLFARGGTTRQIKASTLDRLENLIAALKSNGIRVDVNLHVSRTFTAMDGVPDVDSLQEYGKAINYFDPAVLALHKEFARQLLTHVNPYTGRSLAGDPVMAMVELTNENSLYRYWREGKLKHLSEGGILTARHVRMLDSLWCVFLRKRYGTTTSLAEAWNAGSYPSDGLNRIVNGTFELVSPATGWTLELQTSTSARQARDSVTSASGNFSARVDVDHADGTDWHVQWKQTGLSVTFDSTYVISFAARSDSARTISVALMRDTSPWNWYGGKSVTLGPEWRFTSFSVRAPESSTFGTRLTFSLGGHAGTFWFDDISMVLPEVKGLCADESLEGTTVRRIDYMACARFTPCRVSDMTLFYLSLEEAYYEEMRSYVRDSLGVRVPVAGTNWNAGPVDIAVQSKQDYLDNHSYWDHPTFPGVPWSSTDWLISNAPMVREQNGATIAHLFAGAPVTGKPFTVSEYNHPFPNRYQTEAMLFLPSYAAFHGADGVMFFDYNSSDDWDTDMVANYFSIHRNSAMMALVPSCAAAFRGGMIRPARQTIVLEYSPADILGFPRRDSFDWVGGSLFDRRLALVHGVRAGSFTSAVPFDSSGLAPPPVNPFVTDTREITWNTDGLLSVAAPGFAGATGFLNAFAGQRVGPLTLSAASGFGTITWVSLTGDSLPAARRSLLTVSTMAQNTGMLWEGTTTIHDRWGSSPTEVAPLSMTIRLAVNADSLRIHPLDPFGVETRGYETILPSSPDVFPAAIDQGQTRTVWFGIEAFGSGAGTGIPGGDPEVAGENRLDQNYPNPFNPATVIRYEVSATEDVRLTVFDILGREVAVLVSERKPPGTYAVRFDATGLASGIYFYRLQLAGYVRTRNMAVVR